MYSPAISNAVAATGDAIVEADLRFVPRQTLRRIWLEAGIWPPVSLPVSRDEIRSLLEASARRDRPALEDPREAAALRWWLEHYGQSSSGWRAGGRAMLLTSRFGHVESGQSALAVPAGGSLVLEPWIEAERGRFWAAAGCRLNGPFFHGETAPGLLIFDGWPRPTGMETLGNVRRARGVWHLDWPQVVGGLRLGRWALSAGLQPRRLAPGAGGGLAMDESGAVFPALTLRRTESFRWRGPAGPLAPDALLVRCGRLSEQVVSWGTDESRQSRRDRPWLMQWLLSWNLTTWFRATVTHSSIAVAREGALWPDLLQVNFPGLASTWSETERGPITDRILTFRLEGIFHDAPWRLLPAAAGRLYWEYGGEDIRPDDRLAVLPEIAAPASVIGCELLSPRWDLQLEYAELMHPTVLWYSNGGFADGYTHDGWLLGNPLGGAGESVMVEARWRPLHRWWQAGLAWGRESHGSSRLTPGEFRRQWVRFEVRRDEVSVPWRLYTEWSREEAHLWLDPQKAVRENVWRAGFAIGR